MPRPGVRTESSTGRRARATAADGAVVRLVGGAEGILRAADLYAAGYDKNALRRMVRAGVLVRLCRGTYTRGAPDDDAARHRLLVRAGLVDPADGAVAGHVSAAVLHGLPVRGLGSGPGSGQVSIAKNWGTLDG